MQHCFLFVDVFVPCRLVEHNDGLSRFSLFSAIFLEQEISRLSLQDEVSSSALYTMDFLRLVYIVIPKLQADQEMQKQTLNWLTGGSESEACLSPQNACLVLLRSFSKRYTREKFKLSLIAFNK